jgi:hypothetical protein
VGYHEHLHSKACVALFGSQSKSQWRLQEIMYVRVVCNRFLVCLKTRMGSTDFCRLLATDWWYVDEVAKFFQILQKGCQLRDPQL